MNKNKLVIGIVVLVVLAVILIITNITGLVTLPEEDNTIKIGVVATQTGIGSYLGQQELRGINIALNEINSKGGINGKKIKLIIEDSKTSAKDAVFSINKLINIDNVNYIIGDSWNDTTIAFLPIINENKIITISPVVNLNTLSEDDYFFRLMPKTDDMMYILANYTYNDLNLRKVGAILPGTAYSLDHIQDFEKYFKKLGGEVYIKKITPGQADVKSELSLLKEKNVDSIFVLQFTGLIGQMLKQGKELDMNVIWFSHFSAQANALITDYKNVSDGLYYPYPYDLKNTPNKEFIETYYNLYNEYPDNNAASSYDCLMILAKAITKVGDNPEKIKLYFKSLKDYQGASGIFSFDENGDVQKEIFIKQIKDGKFISLN